MARLDSAQESASAQDQNVTESIGELGTAAAEAGGQIKETATDLTQQVREQATQQVSSQKERIVDTLETVALLVHQAGEQAQQQDKALLASYADKAATQIGQFSEALNKQDVTQIVESTTRFARREPMLFVGGALAAGFLGARFLRSSSQPQSQQQNGQSESTGLADIAVTGTDLPPYDVASANALPDVPLGSTDTTVDDALSSEATGFLEDYEGSVLEGDAFGAETGTTTLPDLEDIESPEKL